MLGVVEAVESVLLMLKIVEGLINLVKIFIK